MVVRDFIHSKLGRVDLSAAPALAQLTVALAQSCIAQGNLPARVWAFAGATANQFSADMEATTQLRLAVANALRAAPKPPSTQQRLFKSAADKLGTSACKKIGSKVGDALIDRPSGIAGAAGLFVLATSKLFCGTAVDAIAKHVLG
jgi:hypothetical protein